MVWVVVFGLPQSKTALNKINQSFNRSGRIWYGLTSLAFRLQNFKMACYRESSLWHHKKCWSVKYNYTFQHKTIHGCNCPSTDRLFHVPTRTTSSGCFVLHRTVHALWNLYGNSYKKSCRNGRRNSHMMREILGNPTSIYRLTNHIGV